MPDGQLIERRTRGRSVAVTKSGSQINKKRGLGRVSVIC